MPQGFPSHTRVLVERRHPNALLPRKAHPSDACYDLALPEEAVLPARSTRILDLHLGVELAEGAVTPTDRGGLGSTGR